MARGGFRFWHQQPVRYRDVDMQHIVYYGKYLEYFDIALYEYFRSLGILIAETAETGEFDTAVVHVEVDYASSARFDQVIDIGVRVERLGGSSFDTAFEIREAGTDREICRAARAGQLRPAHGVIAGSTGSRTNAHTCVRRALNLATNWARQSWSPGLPTDILR